jgi:hypothetical protein
LPCYGDQNRVLPWFLPSSPRYLLDRRFSAINLRFTPN